MTFITPDVEVEDLQELLASVTETVRALRHEMEDLNIRVSAGEEVNTTTIKGAASQMTAQIGLCQKLENNLAECRRRQAGIAPGAAYALDLDAVRTSLGCKLNKLRRCDGTG